MKGGQFVFWLNQLSLHTHPMIEAIASEHPVTVVVGGETAPRLRAYGMPEVNNAVVLDSAEVLASPEMMAQLAEAPFHVFWGLGTYPPVTQAMKWVAAHAPDATLAVFTEPWNPHGWRGIARRIVYGARAQLYGPNLAGIFAAGPLGVEQFRSVSVGRYAVTEFGYSVHPGPALSDGASNLESDIVFVGSLDARKNPHLLFDALEALDGNYSLHIFGDGPLLRDLQARKLARDGGVTFHGVCDNSTVLATVRRARVLVLPSVFDGWGAVVSESLMVGTPVLVSDASGAHCLADAAPGSRTFRSGDAVHLREELEKILPTPWNAQERAHLTAWSARCIAPAALSAHLSTQMALWASGSAETVAAPWRS